MTVPKYEILTNARFFVELKFEHAHEEIDGYFMECQGLKRSHEVISICEVTPQKWGMHNAKTGQLVRTKLPGNSKCENIMLKRGLCISDTFWHWFISVEGSEWGKKRHENIFLTVYNQHAEAKAKFCCSRAWPVSYKIGDLKASASEFELEEVELAVEDFFRVTLDGERITNDKRQKIS